MNAGKIVVLAEAGASGFMNQAQERPLLSSEGGLLIQINEPLPGPAAAEPIQNATGEACIC